jgi:hypothetical protein
VVRENFLNSQSQLKESQNSDDDDDDDENGYDMDVMDHFNGGAKIQQEMEMAQA